MPAADDAWFAWLLQTRHGSDPAYAPVMQRILDDIRDRVLTNAALRPGARIADVGCGDGLVGFGALDREPTATVTFVDISPQLIAHVRERARERGDLSRCTFVVAPATALGAIPDASIDIVTIRAVLAYVPDRPAALHECRRILRPGGRISIAEPIFADRAFALAGIKSQLAAGNTGAATTYFEFLHRCGAAQLPDTIEGIAADPLTNYTERDLVRWFENAGFADIHLRLHIDSVAAPAMPWHVYLATSLRAGVPTLGEILATRFSSDERVLFEQLFRPGVEAGTRIERNTNAYVYADDP